MNFAGISSPSAACRLLVAGAAVASLAASAGAAITHKYTFNNGTAEDSVGGAHATLIDNTGIANYAGGMLNLTGNNNLGSGQDFTLGTTPGAFVDLPDGIFHEAITTTGKISLEMWLEVQTNRPWAQAFAFGTTVGGEGVANGGEGHNYVALIPQSGPGDFRATTRSNSPGNPEIAVIGQATPLAEGQRHHVVLVLDAFAVTPETPQGTATLYLNNGAPVVAAVSPFLNQVDDSEFSNNWLGRSLFPDSLFDGYIDEFRIYNNAMTAGEVAASFTAGPEAALLPVLVVDRGTGAVSIANQTGSAVQIKGYSITSAAGSLNAATWVSIDATNFDTNGNWTAQSSTRVNLTESVTSGASLDGGPLSPNSSRGIGSPWRETPFEDLVFNVTLGDGTTAGGLVQYTGTAAKRSDLSGDGLLTVADWTTFLQHSYTSFGADPAAVAYLKGDLDGDKDNDFDDFRIFKADYIVANGEAAFAALGAVVPEPATLALATFVSTMLVTVGRRSRRRD